MPADIDISDYVRTTRRELSALNEVPGSFEQLAGEMRRETDAIVSAQAAGRSVVPEVQYRDIERNSVPARAIEAIRHRGCAIIRGVFPAAQATAWNEELGDYLDQNSYIDRAREKVGMDTYFGDLADARPQIFGVYWSRPQVMARQAESMANTKRFLNRLWDIRSPMGDEFDPDSDFAYADRTRRRAPGDTTLGLSPHMDAGSYERWLDPAFRQIYAPIFKGHWQSFDPWKAAYRTQTREYSSPAVCSMFRTFQGWTALTPQGPGDGTLQLIPVAKSIAYVLMRSLQDDVPEEQLILANPGRALGVNAESHGDIMHGLVSIPLVEPGDTVWWHPDVVHAVGNEHHGKEYANVIYIGASPVCAKNAAYAYRQAQAFLEGRSAPDFAPENYEVDFTGRATVDDLTALGRRQMAL